MTVAAVRHVRSRAGSGTVLEITPDDVGWTYLSSRIVVLEPGGVFEGTTGGHEVVVVPLGGSGMFTFDGRTVSISRVDVFTAKGHVLYLPPGTDYSITAAGAFEVAIGEAPAEGRYPARLYEPDELATFLRGGANVSRGVTVTLDPTFESERLIAYEIITPSGNWSSFPPHRHDGRDGTTAHEESYYYRLAPEDGFAIQRIYAPEVQLDVSVAASHGDLVLVHEGYHTVAVAPGTNAYYLNFLAGDTKPVIQSNDPAYDWVAGEWTGRPVAIPLGPVD